MAQVIYPVGSDSWAFLDHDLPAAAEGAMLRFVIRQPLPTEYADSKASHLLSSWTPDIPSRHMRVKPNFSTNTIGCATRGIDAVFQEMFEIDYGRLVSNKQQNFFLIFVPAGCELYEKDLVKRQTLRVRTSEEHDLFAEFLQANGAVVYSMQNLGSYEPNGNGSWDYFSKCYALASLQLNLQFSFVDKFPALITKFLCSCPIDPHFTSSLRCFRLVRQ